MRDDNPFSMKLNLLMDGLGAGNADIAAMAGFDRTNISRFRNGKRVARPSNRTGFMLSKALYRYACKNNSTEILSSITGIRFSDSEDGNIKQLSDWLYSGREAHYAGRNETDSKNMTDSRFGKRLDETMRLAGISNVVLSRKLNIDASLIRRYRSGLRIPRSDSEVVSRTAGILYKGVVRNNRLDELAGIMEIKPDELDEAAFSDWLYDFGTAGNEYLSAAEKLMESLDVFSFNKNAEPFDTDMLLKDIPENDTQELYFGREGFRKAVIRFLSDVIRQDKKELFLYSDQDMQWMLGDRIYIKKWAGLMKECLKRGVRVRIIHNLDRSFEELIEAIPQWLPMYMSGLIEPYYCTRVRNSRFNHTIFLCPGAFCVEACLVSGLEDEGIYNFYHDEAHLKMYESSFNRLLKNAKGLLSVSEPPELEACGDVVFLRNGLSPATMPEEFFKTYEDEKIKRRYELESELFFRLLQKGNVCECITLPEKKDTPGFKLHINNILKIMDEHQNYRLMIMPELPFNNYRLMICNEFVRVTYDNNPGRPLYIKHPLLCGAFREYVLHLRRLYGSDRETERQKILSYS